MCGYTPSNIYKFHNHFQSQCRLWHHLIINLERKTAQHIMKKIKKKKKNKQGKIKGEDNINIPDTTHTEHSSIDQYCWFLCIKVLILIAYITCVA